MEKDRQKEISMNYPTHAHLPNTAENPPLLSVRPHWLEILPSLFLISLTVVTLFCILIIVFLKIMLYPHLFALSSLIILLIGGGVMLLTIAHWYYHGYLLTESKIIEYYSLPLLIHINNGILLHQVRCTEIDISKNGIIQHLFDIGDITITFDRPTKQTEFVLKHIYHPDQIGESLNKILDVSTSLKNSAPIWTRNPYFRPNQLLFTEDILPQYIQ